MTKRLQQHTKRLTAIIMVAWLSVVSPAAAWAQTTSPEPTTSPSPSPSPVAGPTVVTGATQCTGASCNQGVNQGYNQGAHQGFDQGTSGGETSPTLQGVNQGSTNGTTGTNSNTGADSTNAIDITADALTNTLIDNTATTTTNVGATATTGSNTGTMNSGDSSITTGSAGIGVTQVINDNSTTIGGTSGLQVSGYNGDYNGDYTVGFGAGTATLTGPNGGSVQAINDTTGHNSQNSVDVDTTTQEITEVQNDGRIDNILELAAITGQNEANFNTGAGSITTGDADVAATLVNLLNTTIINGSLWITVADIFGDLNGNISIPDFNTWLAAYGAQALAVDATNATTGADSTNTINATATDTETTTVTNDAAIATTVTANAITGQNDSLSNTGGAAIITGDGQVSVGNVSVANTTVEGGNWGLFIVNALNGWLGFLVGDQGQVQALSQDETLRHLEATNSTTGSDSDNTVDVTDTRERTTTVTNGAVINNDITADAITGQNEANFNTGLGEIMTGNANIAANTVNIANTTVKDGSLFVAVVNIFGDWFGDILYGGNSLTAAAANNPAQVTVNASNGTTGENSTNEINITYDREHETAVDNDADVTTTVNANIDTGSNHASRNTQGALVDTGDGLLALHTRTIANLTGIAGDTGLAVEITGLNDTTGANSENHINANINDDRIVNVNNEANVSTIIGSANTPALVNTGNNTANQNTLGAIIVTGDAAADVAIQNLVNQVIIALLGDGITVDADFANQLTGALSDNTNTLTAQQRLILSIVNRGFIENLLHLLLNTGGNTANENTGGAPSAAAGYGAAAGGGVVIDTGDICVEGVVDNDLNSVKIAHGATAAAAATNGVSPTSTNQTTGSTSTNGGTVTVTKTTTATVDNQGQLVNDANLRATTGDNEQNRNTGGGAAASAANHAQSACPKLAQAPQPTPTPSPAVAASPSPAPQGGGVPENKPEGQGGAGGGDEQPAGVGGGEVQAPRIAGAHQEKISPAKGILKRFPVAGSEDLARLWQGKKRLPWQLFVIASMGLLAGAWGLDRRYVTRYLGTIA